jgi:hypothetical protein
MAKKTLKSVEPEFDAEQEHALYVLATMTQATSVTKKLFGENQSPSTIYGVYDRLVMDEDTDELASVDLRKAYSASKETFNTENPTPEMVFGLFDRLFIIDEDEDEE